MYRGYEPQDQRPRKLPDTKLEICLYLQSLIVAPELLDKVARNVVFDGVSLPTDVYSYGMIVVLILTHFHIDYHLTRQYEFIERKKVWEEENTKSVMKKIISGERMKLSAEKRKKCKATLRDIFDSAVLNEPVKRTTFAKILKKLG